MIRKAILFGLAVAVLSVMAVVPTQAETLRKGMRNEEIKEIQEMLKKDLEIYPEGYTTGYYGPLTEGAVKRLQKKYDLPQTGVIDDDTKQKIYPWWRRDIKVTSPNGGETWDRNGFHTIEWYVTKGEQPRPMPGESGEGPAEEGETEPGGTSPSIHPVWAKASIDLFRRVTVLPECKSEEEGPECGMPASRRSVFVKHIGTANLFSGSYSWRISNRVKNGDDYLVRVSTGRKVISALEKEESARERALQAMPRRYWKIWDESDKPFTITGETPPPTGDIEEAIKSLKEIRDELRKVSRLLDEVISTLSEL